ncbi:MAG TPA: (d)CMP kinase [Streptosporangiaceae bacterium]|nr:(d)CMP kinase [Streptosporangiaceae bacterium]
MTETTRAPHPGLVIAVDGPAGSGKSSAARGAARALQLRYLDTGAMYRALTWMALQAGVDVSSPAAVAAFLPGPAIEPGTDPAAPAIRAGGIDVSGPIRTREVSNAVSAVASVPAVRTQLIAQQRQIIAATLAAGSGIVAEGRDIGTVVAPEAPVKVYLTASAAVRALRRTAELAGGPPVTAAQTEADQARRDQRDAAQSAMAGDAVEIDSTGLSLAEVVARIVARATAGAGAVWTS